MLAALLQQTKRPELLCSSLHFESYPPPGGLCFYVENKHTANQNLTYLYIYICTYTHIYVRFWFAVAWPGKGDKEGTLRSGFLMLFGGYIFRYQIQTYIWPRLQWEHAREAREDAPNNALLASRCNSPAIMSQARGRAWLII